jgi:flagellar M-ring protein FliF
MPERRLFERDSAKPSASIVIELARDPLTQAQVRAVRNLVASAVPGLSASRVTIADETGKLLASAEGDGAGAAAEALDERKSALEEKLKQDVLAIVESVVGVGAAHIEVSADVDFNRITQTSQTFDPEGRVVRQSITREDSARSNESGGGAATASRNVPDGTTPRGSDANGSQSSGTEEDIRYEISNTTKTEIVEGGRIKRLSVAVAVDGVLTPGAEGAAPTWAARDPQELERLTTLVRAAVGFDEARGDRVDVVNARFTRPEVEGTVAEKPGLFDLSALDPMRGAEILGILIATLALIIFVLRPLVGGMVRPASPGNFPAVAGAGATAGPSYGAAPAGLPMSIDDANDDGASLDAPVEIGRIQGQVKASSVKKVGKVIQDHPEEAIQVVRGWLVGRT